MARLLLLATQGMHQGFFVIVQNEKTVGQMAKERIGYLPQNVRRNPTMLPKGGGFVS
ncbi:hypothetical protein [Roseibium alexandrii]|uniref:hypothetical protein n=1 Tax=Roseibium alexandrii TaxID=388408 RepID=UPI0037527465